MVDPYLRQSPLTHLHLATRNVADGATARISLREVPFRAIVTLRGNVEDPAFVAATTRAIGGELPLKPMTSTVTDQVTALWMGPDEWLIVGGRQDETAFAATLRDAVQVIGAAVTEVGEAMTVIGISGADARKVLAKGCTIDLHAKAFSAGMCVRTLLAKIGVTIHQVDDAPSYELYVHRSFADYAWRWLEDASQEYGVAVVAA